MFAKRRVLLCTLLIGYSASSFSQVLIELDSKEAALAYESAGTYNESNATFEFHDTFNRVGALDITIWPLDDSKPTWRLSLEGPDGQFLDVGSYAVQRYPFQDDGIAGADIASFLGCNRGEGTVDILQIAYDGSGAISQVAADLTYACTGWTRYATAKLRFNSSVPLVQPSVYAIAARELVVAPGAGVNLDGSQSRSDDSAIVHYEWVQLEGEPVELSGVSSSIATFVFPKDKGAFEVLMFRLSVEDTSGRTDSTDVQVITGVKQDRKVMSVIERGTNFVWQQELYRLDPLPETYRFERTAVSGVSVEGIASVLRFTAPFGRNLTVGGYTRVQRSGSALYPALHLSGCNYGPSDAEEMESHFDVLDLQYDSRDSVVRMAVDFRVRCEARYRNTFEGYVRYNSYAPEKLDYPQALAGGDRQIYAGEPAFLNGILSYAPAGSLVAYQWSQVSGIPVQIDDATSPIATIVPPASATTSSSAKFRLDITDDQGNRSGDVVELEIVPVSAPRTFYFAESDDFSFIGRGVSAYRRHLQDTTIAVDSRLVNDRGMLQDYVSMFDDSIRAWHFDLRSEYGTPFKKGAVLDSFSGDPDRITAAVSVGNTGRGCGSATGTIAMLDVDRTEQGVIDTLAADFEHLCQLTNATVRGSIRFNSSVPGNFHLLDVDAGPDLRVAEGKTIELVDSSGSDVRTRWEQAFGPNIHISDRFAKRPTFVAPTIPAGESRYFAFELFNQTSDGGYGRDFIVVRVDDNGMPDWDDVTYEKYVDKPHAYLDGRGEVFGFRTTDHLGNFSRVAVTGTSLVGRQIGELAVTTQLFPVIEVSIRTVQGSALLELFSRSALPSDYAVVVLDVNDQWQQISTGDGLYEEHDWNRLALSIPRMQNDGNTLDLDSVDDSISVKFAVVQMSPIAPPPANEQPSAGGGGGTIDVTFLILLMAAAILSFAHAHWKIRTAQTQARCPGLHPRDQEL